MSVYKSYNPSIWEERKDVIKIVNDLRYGNSFEHFKKKFFDPNSESRLSSSISEENKERLYVTKGAVDEVISKLVAFCPILELSTNIGEEKRVILEKTLKNIKWNVLNTTIYDILESKGDCFLYYYFEEKEDENNKKIYTPFISIIPTEEISDIVLDKFKRPIAYVWRTKHKEETFNFESKKVEIKNETDVVVVFEKGKVTMLEDSDKKSGIVLKTDSKNKITVLKDLPQPQALKDLFSIIHIKSNEVPNTPFSRIPADKYIDDSLRLDQIESDIRGANRLIGFPKLFLVDGQIIDGSTSIGGFASVKSDREDIEEENLEDTLISKGLYNSNRYSQAQIKDIQIKNDLRSMFAERNDVYDSLHEKAGLTPPSLNVHLSKSDSSKVYQQINRRMEQKIQIYIQNTIESFKTFFESILRLEELYDEKTDVNISFKMPMSVLRDSAYDTALTNSIKLKSGEETIQSLLKRQGLSESEIKTRLEQLNQETMLGNSDITYDISNKNGNNLEK